MIPIPLGRRRYGRSWAERILDGAQKVYAPGETLVVAPRRYGLSVRTLALFNHQARPVGASLRFRRRGSVTRAHVEIPAGGVRHLAPRDVGADGKDFFRSCDQILVDARAGAPCASTYFPSHRQVHVFFMNETYREELGGIVARYEGADFPLVQGDFERHLELAFPDHHNAQRRLYEQVGKRFPESQRVLAERGFALPEAQRIPPSIHWIWLRGPRRIRLRERHLRMMQSWARHNPAFTLNLWTDLDDFGESFKRKPLRRLFNELFAGRLRLRGAAEIEALFESSTLPNAGRLHDVFRHAANPAPRSDILRLMVLDAEGGVYCDMTDTECLGSIRRYCDRFAFVVGMDAVNRIHNAVVASAPGHPVVRGWLGSVQEDGEALNRKLAESADVPEYFFTVLRVCGPYALTHALCALLEAGALGPDVLVLPFPFFHNPRTLEPTPLSVVVHHSYMSWVPERPGMLVHSLPERLRERVLRWVSTR